VGGMNLFVREMSTSRHDENVVTATGRVYRVIFVDDQVLDFVVEVRMISSLV